MTDADYSLRGQVAAAMRDAVKRRTMPPILGPCGHPISGGTLGLTENDLADIAVRVVLGSVTGYCERMVEMAQEMGGDELTIRVYQDVVRAFASEVPDGA